MDPLGFRSETSPPKIVPVKVRRKHLTETERLEIENRKMEERLQALKEALSREKEARKKMGGGIWRSGKQGALTNHAAQVLEKNKEKREKRRETQYKTLSDSGMHLEPLPDAPVPRPPPSLPREPAVPLVPIDPLGGSQSSRSRTCGQCEVGSASVSCIECKEFYCDECFVDIHKKGALRSHTVKRMQEDNLPRFDRSRRFKTTSRPQSAGGRSDTSAHNTDAMCDASPASNSLLEGTFDERESHHSFLEALNEWRGVTKKPAEKTSSAASTSAAVGESPSPPRVSAERAPATNVQPRMWNAEDSHATAADTVSSRGTLLEGDFNEDESHKYFLDALEAWRNKHGHGASEVPHQKPPAKPSVGIASSGIQTETGDADTRPKRKPTDVPIPESQQSLSYMERLLVKQYRKDPHVIERVFRSIIGDGESGSVEDGNATTESVVVGGSEGESSPKKTASSLEERLPPDSNPPPTAYANKIEATDVTEAPLDGTVEASANEPIVSEPPSPRAAAVNKANTFEFDASIEELNKAASAIQRQFRRRRSEVGSTTQGAPASPTPQNTQSHSAQQETFEFNGSVEDQNRAAALIQAQFRRRKSVQNVTSPVKSAAAAAARPSTAGALDSDRKASSDCNIAFNAPVAVQHKAASVIQAQFRKRQASLRDLNTASSRDNVSPKVDLPTDAVVPDVTSEASPSTSDAPVAPLAEPVQPAQETFDFGTPIEDQEKAAALMQSRFRMRKAKEKAAADKPPTEVHAVESPVVSAAPAIEDAVTTTEAPSAPLKPAQETFDFGTPIEDQEKAAALMQSRFRMRKAKEKAAADKPPTEVHAVESPVVSAAPAIEDAVTTTEAPSAPVTEPAQETFDFGTPIEDQEKAAALMQSRFRMREAKEKAAADKPPVETAETADAPVVPAVEPASNESATPFEFDAPLDVQNKAASIIQSQFRRRLSMQAMSASSDDVAKTSSAVSVSAQMTADVAEEPTPAVSAPSNPATESIEFDAPIEVQHRAASVIQAQFRQRILSKHNLRPSTSDSQSSDAATPDASDRPVDAPPSSSQPPQESFDFDAPLEDQHKAAAAIQKRFRMRKASATASTADLTEASVSQSVSNANLVPDASYGETTAADMSEDSMMRGNPDSPEDDEDRGGPLADDFGADDAEVGGVDAGHAHNTEVPHDATQEAIESQIELDPDMMDPTDGKDSRKSVHGLDENDLMQDFEEMERRVESEAAVRDDDDVEGDEPPADDDSDDANYDAGVEETSEMAE
eukprot:Opistho-2@86891